MYKHIVSAQSTLSASREAETYCRVTKGGFRFI